MLQNPSNLYHQLIKFAGQYSQWSDLRHPGVMCWMIVGLIAEGKVNLTKWIDHICSKAQIAWESTSGEHWYIISTEPTNLQTFREYGFRFTIEENF